MSGSVVRARADEAVCGPALSIETPDAGATLGDPLGLVLVSGSVATDGPEALDLVLAVDTSHSTRARGRPRGGWRRWLAWLLPRTRGPEAPSALEAEIDRGLELLARLDARTTRVGVIAFAGDFDPLTRDARVVAPLGAPDRARDALRALRRHEPRGATNLLAALDLARVELRGEPGADSRARDAASRVLLLLTDGADVHPLHPEADEARARLRAAVERTRAAGLEVEALRAGDAPLSAALDGLAAGGGRWLDSTAASSALAGRGALRVEIRNLSSPAPPIAIERSGSRFAALVPLAAGRNELELLAWDGSGARTRRALELRWDPAAGARSAPARLVAVHNRLLAAHLRELRAARARRSSLSIAIDH